MVLTALSDVAALSAVHNNLPQLRRPTGCQVVVLSRRAREWMWSRSSWGAWMTRSASRAMKDRAASRMLVVPARTRQWLASTASMSAAWANSRRQSRLHRWRRCRPEPPVGSRRVRVRRSCQARELGRNRSVHVGPCTHPSICDHLDGRKADPSRDMGLSSCSRSVCADPGM